MIEMDTRGEERDRRMASSGKGYRGYGFAQKLPSAQK
jgi:hypothetical protein